MTRLRLFVAIPIPAMVRDAMASAQVELRELAPREAVRWTIPEQFHLTLKFLGDVAVEQAGPLKESVGAVCQASEPSALRAQGIGFFPNGRRPRVIWAGIPDETGGLAGLQKQIETAVRPFAENSGEENSGGYSGHVTLGRVRVFRRGCLEKLLRHAGEMAGSVFGEWMAREVEIVRSELSANGARHTVLATFALGVRSPPEALK